MRQFVTVLLLGAALMMVACGGGDAETVADAKPTQVETPGGGEDLTTNATIMATLNAADAFDGTADKVISKCASCALMMDGKPEMKADVAGFEMHFCSAPCQDSYKNDAKGRLETLKIPSE